MAGRNAREAFANYLTPMQEALQCITLRRFSLPASLKKISNLSVNQEYSAALNNMSPVALGGAGNLYFSAGQNFRIIRVDDERGPFKVQTTQYLYAISDVDENELVSFHWTPEETNPGTVTEPHMHIGSVLLNNQQILFPGLLHKSHIPTGRVSIESVIRCAIREFGVTPTNPNWVTVLSRSEAAFTTWRTRAQ